MRAAVIAAAAAFPKVSYLVAAVALLASRRARLALLVPLLPAIAARRGRLLLLLLAALIAPGASAPGSASAPSVAASLQWWPCLPRRRLRSCCCLRLQCAGARPRSQDVAHQARELAEPACCRLAQHELLELRVIRADDYCLRHPLLLDRVCVGWDRPPDLGRERLDGRFFLSVSES